jgi:hypothetical protein
MKSVAILAALAGSAAAFAPAQVARTNSAVNAMTDMVGGEGPEPMPFSPGQTSVNFDPAGFAEVCREYFREGLLPQNLCHYEFQDGYIYIE